VCLSASADFFTSGEQSALEGDKNYIHLNYQLEGKFQAQVKDVLLDCRQGDTNMVSFEGEMFYPLNSENNWNITTMIVPEVLYELAGEELVGRENESKSCDSNKNRANEINQLTNHFDRGVL
jgi:AraC family transcriptional regulator